MFDDILGPRPTKVRYDGVKKPYEGEKDAKPASVGGVKGPIGMAPKKNPIPVPPNILGGPNTTAPAGTPGQVPDDDDEPELELDFDYDDPDEDCDGCDDCSCDDIGCLKDEDEDIWSAIG